MRSSLSIAAQTGVLSAPFQKSDLAVDVYIHSSKLGVTMLPSCTGVQQGHHACPAAHLPGSEGEGFAGRADTDAALAHAGQAAHGDVPAALKHQVLIHLEGASAKRLSASPCTPLHRVSHCEPLPSGLS